MSVTLNELSYRIFNIIKPKISDDESIDISEIQYDIENTRAMLLKRAFSNKFKTQIPESITQTIPKIEIGNMNSSELYPDIPSDKVLMRTNIKLPGAIEKTSGMPLIKRISAATLLSTNFTVTTPQHAIYSGNGKFNQKNVFCFFENGYLYLLTSRILNKALKYITIQFVAERPTEVFDFMNDNYSDNPDDRNYDEGVEYTNDSAYPMDMDMITDLEEVVIKNRLRIEASQPIDDINDSSDTPKQITPNQ